MKKRIWSLLLAVVMVLSLIPATAMTADAVDYVPGASDPTNCELDQKHLHVCKTVLESGQYLDSNKNISTTKPKGSYIYIEIDKNSNCRMVLHDYKEVEVWVSYDCYSIESLTVVLEGDNEILCDGLAYPGFTVEEYPVIIEGTGTLTMDGAAGEDGMRVHSLTMNSGTVTVTFFNQIDWGSFVMNGGSFTATDTFRIHDDSDLIFNGGSLNLCGRSTGFAIDADQETKEKVIEGINGRVYSVWAWFGDAIPDLSTASGTLGVSNHYKDADNVFETETTEGVPSGDDLALSTFLYLHKDVAINTLPVMPEGKKEVNQFVGPGQVLSAEPNAKLFQGLCDLGYRQSLAVVLFDSEDRCVAIKTMDTSEMEEPIQLTLKNLPYGNYKYVVASEIYNSKDKCIRDLTYTFNLIYLQHSLDLTLNNLWNGERAKVELYEYGTDKLVATKTVTGGTDNTAAVNFTNLTSAMYDVKIKSVYGNFEDCSLTCSVGPDDYYDNEYSATLKKIYKFVKNPSSGTVGYNQLHIVNWSTNFEPVMVELLTCNARGAVVQTRELNADAVQASLSYLQDGYYYLIRAYYDFYYEAYADSRKIYVTTDQYFTPVSAHGKTEEDIIDGITYVPNGDGTFNANVHVDVSYVDGQMVQHAWKGTGYKCYQWYENDKEFKAHTGIVEGTGGWYAFTIENVGRNLVPGDRWSVKVYLSEDPECDSGEWQGYSFAWINPTVPELKPEFYQFTVQPSKISYCHGRTTTVTWETNFNPTMVTIVTYDVNHNVVQTEDLSPDTVQAELPYLDAGYYYRIRAYYGAETYSESDKFYVTTDQYYTPNRSHGNTEMDIIEGISYVPNDDGTFNANVHVNVSCVDERKLQVAWIGTGYYWYDHNNTLHSATVDGIDTSKYVFTLNNVGKNLEPGKEWRVKVYLSEISSAEREWPGHSFNYFIDTVPELKPEDQFKNPFTDVPEGSFYYDPVMWAVQNGITTGATATTFNPNGTCLRAQVVTFLHRAAGNPEPTSTKNPFTDVKSTDFFYKPVLWAVEKGITNGTSATKFGSLDNCNRAAVVTFLWRAAGSPEPKSSSNPFVDVKTTDFFYKSVLWAIEKGITNGVDATHFGPTTACNRAQVVTFLYRAYN